MYQKSNIPNKAFDTEYSTQFRREMEYLKDKGFEPTFVRKSKDGWNIHTYKYKKTSKLFMCIAEFYDSLEKERAVT